MLLLRFFSAARLWPSLRCCVLNTAAFLLLSYEPLPFTPSCGPCSLIYFYIACFYWDVRLSVVGAVMDAHVQKDILLRDRTRNPAVVGGQPHPNSSHPSYSSVGRPCRGITPPPLGAVWGSIEPPSL